MKALKLSLVLLLIATCISCNNKQSLQEYYIDSKENDKFIMVDLPTSLIAPKSENLSEDQQRIIASVKKVNLLAYAMKDTSFYNSETNKVNGILNADNYDELMKLGTPEQRMRVFIKGDEDAIDEVVVFAQDNNKGFLLARVLGDNMNVADMVRFAETMDTSSAALNTGGFEGIMDVFK
ncbi:putative protein DUF4252 [Leeuwenhoekiella aestuarii]|uniref:DUF4252 domain-containing protein n=1 Tax=Leeuwenhoekiella aestuarii TaxID=2249426 RepID=A0A4Q0NX26_9FLAO|nr:DUF4252 domain-containing protein [Leeuwenhoekiella aestuarii]RXG15637.1 putative protein DUF4252 [Leeuwenhoekiella aestuarii]RXG17254.1 putative protein DUF4252 [Leeuwenhoekiella aestuarii]